MLFAYNYNDICDRDMDAQNPRKKGQVTAPAAMSVVMLLAFLMLLLTLPLRIGVALLVFQAFWFAYSHPRLRLKGVALASVLIHVVSGAGYFLCGFLLHREIASLAASPWFGAAVGTAYFSLLYTSGGIVAGLVDHDADKAYGLRTPAVVLGRKVAFAVVALLQAAALCMLSLLVAPPLRWAFLPVVLGGYLLLVFRYVRSPLGDEVFLRYRRDHRLYFSAVTALAFAWVAFGGGAASFVFTFRWPLCGCCY
jgi:4-hydroxybenzoate polyprenyltransferase